MFMDIEGVELRGRRSSKASTEPTANPTQAMAGNAPVAPQPQPQQQPRGRQCLYFDLETIPDYSRQNLFGMDPIPELPPVMSEDELMCASEFITQDLAAISRWMTGKNPPATWVSAVEKAEKESKKPRKGLFDVIESYWSMARNLSIARDDQRKKMSVTPEFCRIVAMGWAIGGQDEQSTIVDLSKEPDLQERLILTAFWSLARQHGPVVGYNITGFDLNVIRARSAILGIQPTRNYADVKPWDQSAIIDLMLSRFPKGGAMKLKALARLYGIEPPAGDCDGSQVEELARTDPEKLGEYVRSDVWLVRELHRKWMGYFTVS